LKGKNRRGPEWEARNWSGGKEGEDTSSSRHRTVICWGRKGGACKKAKLKGTEKESDLAQSPRRAVIVIPDGYKWLRNLRNEESKSRRKMSVIH